MSTDELKSALRVQARAVRRIAATQDAGKSGFGLAATFIGAMETIGIATEAAPKTVVAGYWPMGSEIDCRPLMDQLHQRGIALALPVVVSPDAPLDFRRWQPGDDLEAGARGTLHPLAVSPVVRPRVVLVPLLAFDATGHRLGQGGGYYDRTLQTLSRRGHLIRIGIAFMAQRMDVVPHSEYDQPLDWVATEAALVKTG